MAESDTTKEKNNSGRSRVHDGLPHDLAVAVVGSAAGAVVAEGAKRLFDKLAPKEKPKPSRKPKK